jgi:hypothetical protein
MQCTFDRVLLKECRAHAVAPAAFVTRAQSPPDHWLVAASPLREDGQILWTTVSDGTLVHIPVFPYLTVPDPPAAMAYMASLGASAIVQAGIPRPLRLHIVYGDLIESVQAPGGDGYQVHVGFALRVR